MFFQFSFYIFSIYIKCQRNDLLKNEQKVKFKIYQHDTWTNNSELVDPNVGYGGGTNYHFYIKLTYLYLQSKVL